MANGSAARQGTHVTAVPAPALTIVKSRRGVKTRDLQHVTETQREYAPCRVLGHEWHHVGRAAEDASRFGVYGFRSTCSHCGAERTKWLARTGLSTKVAYRYPKDYQTRGEDKLIPSQWRRVLIVSLADD